MELSAVRDFDEAQIDVTAMESYMSQFEGGEISIVNDHWHDGIALIKIDNVEKKNAISGKMMIDFGKCVAQLESWKGGKAVILYGCGDNFCSGGDLEFARRCGTPKDAFCLSYLMQDVLFRLKQLPLVSVALVHGPTLGGGAEIAVSCDYVLVCDDVRFGFVHAKMGITTAWGGTARLVGMLGEKRALELLLSAKMLDAEQCVDLGLASDILDSEGRMERCLEWTKNITRHHYTVVRSFKLAATLTSSGRTFRELLEDERKLFVPLWGARPNREALDKQINHIKK